MNSTQKFVVTQPPLRIGIDGHVLTGKLQGTRTTLAGLLRALPLAEVPHDVFVFSENPAEADELVGNPGLRHAPVRHAGSLERLLQVFPALFRAQRIDIGVFQYVLPLWAGRRTILFIHDILPITHPRFFGWLNRWLVRLTFGLSIRRADAVVTVSHFTRDAVKARYGLSDRRLRSVRNGPSFAPAVYNSTPEPGMLRYVLAVGRIEQRKNVPLLVEAFLRARPPGVRLRIVGSHDYGFDYRLPKDPCIEWLQGVDDAGLIALYRGASLFAYPSAAEGFGLPLLDALLFGIPVVSSNQTAMPEIAGDLAAYFDPTADNAITTLAALIAGHFADRPIPAPNAEQRATLLDTFNWDRAARDFISVVAGLAPVAADG